VARSLIFDTLSAMAALSLSACGGGNGDLTAVAHTPAAAATDSVQIATGPSAMIAPAEAQVCIPGQGTWESTLRARDYDGDGVPDAFYDTALDVTWLADAGASGQRLFEDASDWAAALRVGGQGGWRLPTLATDVRTCSPAPPHECEPFIVEGTSELEHMYSVTLGNGPNLPLNVGPFRRLQKSDYFTNRTAFFIPSFQSAWIFDVRTGRHTIDGDHLPRNGWAVHEGDVRSSGS
jgi:hypothetical protein